MRARRDAPAGETAPPPARALTVARTIGDLGMALLPLLAAATATWLLLELPASHLLICLLVYVALAGALMWLAPAGLPRPGIGWANRITLVRAAVSIPVVAVLLDPGFVPTQGAWWIIALAGGTLALDGLDGAVARRSATETTFGARFDMEVDAFLILVLSLLVWTSTPLGPWVVGIGAIRYLFVAAAYAWPFLSAPLPPSLRRQTICVVQSVGLLICLAPAVTTSVRTAAALLALGLLLYSFGVDVRWLAVNAPRGRRRAT